MFPTLMKILPVLWPFFKEMVLGGKKDPEATEKPTRLKALFYIIVFLLVALGYGASQAFTLFQKLHGFEVENARLLEKTQNSETVLDTLKAERDSYRSQAFERYDRIRELRDIQLKLTEQLSQANARLDNSNEEKARLEKENKELSAKLSLAEGAARQLDTFKTTSQSPKRLLRHNQAVDVLKQLREESSNDNAR